MRMLCVMLDFSTKDDKKAASLMKDFFFLCKIQSALNGLLIKQSKRCLFTESETKMDKEKGEK